MCMYNGTSNSTQVTDEQTPIENQQDELIVDHDYSSQPIDTQSDVGQSGYMSDFQLSDESEIVCIYDLPPPFFPDLTDVGSVEEEQENSFQTNSNTVDSDSDTTHSTPTGDTCYRCADIQLYEDLRMCHSCQEYFCSRCLPQLDIAILQCCNFHNIVFWFCSSECRCGYDRESVRTFHRILTDCL